MLKQYVDQKHANEVCRAISAYDKMRKYPDGLAHNGYVSSNTLHEDADLNKVLSSFVHSDYVGSYTLHGVVNLNKILKCLPALTLKSEYEIYYLISGNECGESVIPYIIKKGGIQLQNMDDYLKHIKEEGVDNWVEEFGKYIQIEDTPEGYFDFAVFLRYIRNLYLFGHDNYLYIQMLYAEQQIKHFCEHHGLEEDDSGETYVNDGFGMAYTDEDVKKLQSLDTRSFVEKDKYGNVTVSFLAESQWGGIFRYKTSLVRRITLAENDTEEDADEEYDFIIPHNCGIMF